MLGSGAKGCLGVSMRGFRGLLTFSEERQECFDVILAHKCADVRGASQWSGRKQWFTMS